jgi:hypothetical protein
MPKQKKGNFAGDIASIYDEFKSYPIANASNLWDFVAAW